ncbi:hypothetical protein B5C34_07610 [Pacificimonas flava]|uniref:Outer membrane protein n=2 Tax=Pacificimonas TaxID=1960290 RepID=A0A219B4P5_9SPHN|nr:MULTISPECIES: SIMPL domain-containing protein [Pacificimonas]MBZ6379473.1 SIMPL domain-containing protein [Pacificimonas aurantium]OWV33335.1 hypothetical protein B5C34_07610 [Pacificimonas flava]
MRLVDSVRAVAGCLAIATLAPVCSSAAAQSLPELGGATLLQVRARGEAVAVPDVAVFSVGITTTGDTARQAIDENSALASKIADTLDRMEVAPRDIQTRSVSVQPEFERGERGAQTAAPRILGYVANNSVTVRLRDLDKAPDILDALFEAGANTVNGPSFQLEEGEEEVLSLARRDAVRQALAEARAYAEGFGMSVASILRISDSGPLGVSATDVITVTGSRVQNYEMAVPAPPPPPLAQGEITRSAQLYVDFLLVPAD